MSDETKRTEDEWLRRVAAGDAATPWSRSTAPTPPASIVQETFVRLWQSAHRFDPARGSARAFTFTIAQRVADAFLVREAVETLSPKHREVITMSFDPASTARVSDDCRRHRRREGPDGHRPGHRPPGQGGEDRDADRRRLPGRRARQHVVGPGRLVEVKSDTVPDKRGITAARFLIAADPEKFPDIEVTREPGDGDPA